MNTRYASATTSNNLKIVQAQIRRLLLVDCQVEIYVQTATHPLIEEVAAFMVVVVILCIIFCFFYT